MVDRIDGTWLVWSAQVEAHSVMLSASHNAMPDKGIKFFARGGQKLADELEDAIEAPMNEPWDRPTGSDVGRVLPLTDGTARHIAHQLAALPHRLDGLHVVMDAAHGAASVVALEAFRQAGATVTVISCEPDGLNINDGYGSTHLEKLQKAEAEAECGIALDGDADRCLAVDAQGADIDGHQTHGDPVAGHAQAGRARWAESSPGTAQVGTPKGLSPIGSRAAKREPTLLRRWGSTPLEACGHGGDG